MSDDDLPKHLEHFRKAISAKGFGVTQIGRDVTFRWTGPQGEHMEVTAVVTRVYDSTVQRCQSCGGRAERLNPVEISHQLCAGPPEKTTEFWCYVCYCPK